MTSLRVAFLGTPEYAVPTLEALVDAGHDVVTVVAQPDRPSGRGKKLRSPPTIVRARELGLNTRQPRAVRSGTFYNNYLALDIDVAVVVAYGRILPIEIINSPKYGSINAHGSILPRWRGAAPIERSIVSGDKVTGVTIMQMDEGLDTGDMILVAPTEIGPDDTSLDLRHRMSKQSADMVVEVLRDISSITVTPQPTEGILHADMLSRADSVMDFSRPAAELHNQVRGLRPWPGTTSTFRGEVFKIHKTRLVEGSGAPGEVLCAKGRLIVACGEGALEIIEAQTAGKRAMAGSVISNGNRIQTGEILS